MSVKKIIDVKSTKDLAVAMFYYTSGSILGPLLVFGGLGYYLDKFFHTTPLLIVIGIIVAFITTNILLFKKLRQLNRTINKYAKLKKKEDK